MAQSPWKPSMIAKLEQLSTVEVRHNVFRQRDIRPGHTTAIPGMDAGVEGHSLQFEDGQDRPRVLAPHLKRIQNGLDFDGQPRRKGNKTLKMSDGQLGRALESQERVAMPDRRDEKGHNLKNRITVVRNRGTL